MRFKNENMSNIMDEPTLNALKESIEHWQRLVDIQNNPNERPRSTDCALCKMFLTTHCGMGDCTGCPVMMKTGEHFCQSTPYRQAHSMYIERLNGTATTEDFVKAAKLELEFLKSLLP